VAASLNNVELVITALEDESVFKRKTKDIKELARNLPISSGIVYLSILTKQSGIRLLIPICRVFAVSR